MLIGTYTAKYIYKSMCGFVKDHTYIIEIDKDRYGYTIVGIQDLDENIYVDACMNFSSEKSVRQHWIIQEDLTVLEV